VVLSVNEPKVPRPATATAAPRTPNEATILRALPLVRMLGEVAVIAVSCAGPVCRGIPATDRP
jgi:hypothetical protein